MFDIDWMAEVEQLEADFEELKEKLGQDWEAYLRSLIGKAPRL